MTEAAALALRKGVMRGDYPPGCRLVPAKLEEELKLSRTAIREAIRELVGTGLADAKTHKGACVAEPLDMAEIEQIFKLRYELEGDAAYLGTKQITQEGTAEMETLLDQMSKPELAGRYIDFLLNQRFHVTLYQASGWRYLTKVIDRIFDQILVFRGGLYQRLGADLRESLLTWKGFEPYNEDHIQIMSHVRAGNASKARRAVIDNLKRGLDGLQKIESFLNQQSSTPVAER